MKKNTSAQILKIAISLFTSASWAFEFSPILEIHGYGTLGASMTNATNVEIVSPVTKAVNWDVPQIFGINNKPTFSEDTLGGIRFTAKSQYLAFIADFLSEGAQDYLVLPDFLYLQLEIDDTWNFKLGRMHVPLFLFSDYTKIGYSFPWSRLPAEFYGFFASNSNWTGLLLQHSFPLGKGWLSQEKVGFGQISSIENIYSMLDIQAKNITTFEWFLSNDHITLHAEYALAALTTIYPPDFILAQEILNNPCGIVNAALAPELITVSPTAFAGECIYAIQGIPPFPSPYSTLAPDGLTAKKLSTKNANTKLLTLGYNFNWNHILSIAEWRTSHVDDTVLPGSQSWYALLGYEWHDLLFHATYATIKTNKHHRISNSISSQYINPFSLFSPPPLPIGEIMETSINELLSDFNVAESSIDVGLRYNIIPDAAALKFDYRYVMPQDNTHGLFTTPFGPVSPGKRISWVTAVVNIIF